MPCCFWHGGRQAAKSIWPDLLESVHHDQLIKNVSTHDASAKATIMPKRRGEAAELLAARRHTC